jgi:hypothetical protein
MKNTFSITDSLNMGYDMLKRRFGAIMLLVVITIVSELFFQYAITTFLLLFGPWTSVIATLLSNVVNTFFGLALLLKMIALYDDNDIDLSVDSFFSTVKKDMFIRYVITSLLYGVIVALPIFIFGGIGVLIKLYVIDQLADPSSPLIILLAVIYLVACSIVVIHLIMRFLLAPFFIADEITKSPVEALKLSAKACKKNVGHLSLFALAIIAVSILGVILFLIGILFVYPIIIIATVHVYRSLAHKNMEFNNVIIEEVE